MTRGQRTIAGDDGRPGTMIARHGRKARGGQSSIRLLKFLAFVVVVALGRGIGQVHAVPVAQGDGPAGATVAASPGATLSSAISVATESPIGSSSSLPLSTTTTSIPGTVVTDSPLVRTHVSDQGLSSSLRNQSALTGTATAVQSTSAHSAVETQTLPPSPTTSDSSDGPGSTQQEQTYNSLVN